MNPEPKKYHPLLFCLSLLMLCATLLLILLGGYTKSFEAGLSFPDWPTSDGYLMWLFPFKEMVGKKFWEHSHRLTASFVGFLMVATTFCAWKLEISRKIRNLVNLGVFLVIFQGLLGGLTVLLGLEKKIVSIFHAGLAQVFLALVAALVLLFSKKYQEFERRRDLAFLSARLLPPILLAQTLLGACYRHWLTSSWLLGHVLFAFVALGGVAAVCVSVYTAPKPPPFLKILAHLLILTVLFQLGLGVHAYYWRSVTGQVAVVPVLQATLATLHVLGGAFLMLLSVGVYMISHLPFRGPHDRPLPAA
jgi:cytochrome c oxidase assembly protein subunit 15